ncbi:MAG: hypothetical protein ABXS93_07460 [Sulfurimonas sp.]
MMKKIILCLLPALLLAETIYESKFSDANKKAMNNPKIKCRTVCDKKLYRQQEISKAVSFYKDSKRYKFTANGFDPLR